MVIGFLATYSQALRLDCFTSPRLSRRIEMAHQRCLPFKAPDLENYLAQENSLAANWPRRRIDRRLPFSPLRLAFGTCMVLLLLIAVAHAAIGHPVTGDADHCSLCAVAHSLVPIGLLAVAEVLIRLQGPAPELMEEHAVVRYWHSALFTRPPPVCS